MPFLVGMPRGADVRVSGALILAALVACGRPAASRAPAIADAPASERPEPAVDEPALASDIAGHTVDAEVASVAAEPRAAGSADRRVFVEPPSVSQDRMDVWGGESATEFEVVLVCFVRGALRDDVPLSLGRFGLPSAAEAEAPALGGVAACVLEVARAWRFPPAERGSQITASFALGTEVAPREAPRGPSCRR